MTTPRRWPTIADHRLLGDGRSVALLQHDGTVDWWCAPEPDDPPLLWSLLDPDGPSAGFEGAHVLDVPGAASLQRVSMLDPHRGTAAHVGPLFAAHAHDVVGFLAELTS